MITASDLVLREIANIVQEVEQYNIIVDKTSDINNTKLDFMSEISRSAFWGNTQSYGRWWCQNREY